jgi:phasin family protein
MSKKPIAAGRSRAIAAAPAEADEAPIAPTLTVVDEAPVAAAPAAVEETTPTPTVTQGMKTMINKTEDFVAFGKDNLEAFTAAGKIWAAGVQDLTKQVAATAKANFDESVASFKALTSVKSVKEAVELQSAFSKSAIEKALAESAKLTEASIKLTEQALAPITARINVAVQTFAKAA